MIPDDEILAAAARIKARRLAQSRLASLETGTELMIRWTDRTGGPGRSEFVSVPVTAEQVEHLVRAHFEPIIARNTTFPSEQD